MSSQTDEALDLLRAVWWLLVIFGVIAIGVGVFLLADPHESLEHTHRHRGDSAAHRRRAGGHFVGGGPRVKGWDCSRSSVC